MSLGPVLPPMVVADVHMRRQSVNVWRRWNVRVRSKVDMWQRNVDVS
jgi:hypothetical protein